jgi:cupin fold WbuC family metalloprotein
MAERIQLIDQALLDRTIQKALAAPRLRTNHNFHESAQHNPHRFLNALVRGTYCPPHRHLNPPKSESFLALRGEIVFFVFDDDGTVRERHVLGRDSLLGIDVEPGVWHSIAVLTDTAVCYEVKPGPWDPGTDKDYPAWAPREGDPRAGAYLQELLAGLQPS